MTEKEEMRGEAGRHHIARHLGAQFGLSTAQIEALLPDFLKTLGSHLEGLETALRQAEPETLARAAHTLKGALLNLGLAPQAGLAREIEERARAGAGPVDYPSLVARLRVELSAYLD